MPAPPPPNFNVDSKFLMDLCWVTSAEIISQMSEQSAANIEIGGKGEARHALSHSNVGVQKISFVAILCLCEIISVNCSNLRNYFHRSDPGDCAHKCLSNIATMTVSFIFHLRYYTYLCLPTYKLLGKAREVAIWGPLWEARPPWNLPLHQLE